MGCRGISLSATASAANRNAAETSSSSNGGSSATIWSGVMPSAIIPTTVATGMRSPRMHGTPPICRGLTVTRSITPSYPCARWRAAGFVGGGDGRPVYGMGGLDGLGGRMGGQEPMSGDWDGLSGGFSSRCQGEGRGFESRRPLHKILPPPPSSAHPSSAHLSSSPFSPSPEAKTGCWRSRVEMPAGRYCPSSACAVPRVLTGTTDRSRTNRHPS